MPSELRSALASRPSSAARGSLSTSRCGSGGSSPCHGSESSGSSEAKWWERWNVTGVVVTLSKIPTEVWSGGSESRSTRLPGPVLDRSDHLGLGVGIGVHVRPLLRHQRPLGLLIEVTILGVLAQVVAQQQIVVGFRCATGEDVHVYVALGCAHHPVSGLAHPQFIACAQKWVEVVLLGGDVVDTDEDVDDRKSTSLNSSH